MLHVLRIAVYVVFVAEHIEAHNVDMGTTQCIYLSMYRILLASNTILTQYNQFTQQCFAINSYVHTPFGVVDNDMLIRREHDNCIPEA